MYCPKCGNKLTDDSLFCSSCGANISNTINTEQADTHKSELIIDNLEDALTTECFCDAHYDNAFLISCYKREESQVLKLSELCKPYFDLSNIPDTELEGIYAYDISNNAYDEIKNKIITNLNSAKNYAVTVNGKIVIIDANNIEDFKMSDDYTQLIFVDATSPDAESGELKQIKIDADNNISKATVYDTDVCSISLLDNNNYAYYKKTSEKGRALYFNKQKIDDITTELEYVGSCIWYNKASKELYYSKNSYYINDILTHDIYKYSNGKSKSVAPNVNGLLMGNDGNVFILNEYSPITTNKSLSILKNGGLNKITDNVRDIYLVQSVSELYK